jgi:exosortase
MLLGLVVLLNLGVFRDLISDWYRDDNYSHGFFIIPVSIALFWRKRHELVPHAKPSGWGIVLFLIGCIGMIFGIAASEYFTTRFSLVLVITGIGLHQLGMENFRKVWFSFFFLFFMIPIPSVIYYSATLPMQLFGSKVTAWVLHSLGVPAIRQGNVIHLQGYSLEVAEACSGLRSLVTLMALGALYGYMFMPGRWLPFILFAATVPIAILTNIIRLLFTAIGAYAISTELAEEFLHELSGILVFITALFFMLILGVLLKWLRNRFS